MRNALIMTPAKRRAFVEDGVVVLSKLVSLELCRAAVEAIEAAETENAGGSEPVQALYHSSPLGALLQELLGGDTQPVTGAQIAVRHPTPPEQLDRYMGGPTPSPSDWNGHMDGIAIHPGPHKGDPDREAPIISFSCLVGVALNDQNEPDCGNFAVLRGSHTANAAFFAQQAAAGGPLGPGGPDWPLEPWHREEGSNSSRGQRPHLKARMIPPPTRAMGDSPRYVDGGWWPSGTQQLLHTGDVVLAHYLACHGESRHAGKEPRKMVFFRVKHRRHTQYRPGEHHTDQMQHMTAVLSDPWLEWEGLGVT
ncbi:MAG: hypothetical protein GKR89_12890 [Candidatus Latescibacteria bacterium]|nr:hypothetical protein [Candidatus Latescibacterota bacterium]